ncbi:hypothetical protein SAMN05444169_7634 [Bradyrhizobium erythrophlei]|uniref:Uncharacterized protein n=1 Tax=Bradyrhizobium erythrophlei TaxID=1437360 RepID=A0A1M5TAQ6_9BRAD|nr:hypothetical protein SAMN05444169_7634 [Bradyrhizobium erythrophlei]
MVTLIRLSAIVLCLLVGIGLGKIYHLHIQAAEQTAKMFN